MAGPISSPKKASLTVRRMPNAKLNKPAEGARANPAIARLLSESFESVNRYLLETTANNPLSRNSAMLSEIRAIDAEILKQPVARRIDEEPVLCVLAGLSALGLTSNPQPGVTLSVKSYLFGIDAMALTDKPPANSIALLVGSSGCMMSRDVSALGSKPVGDKVLFPRDVALKVVDVLQANDIGNPVGCALIIIE